MSAEQAKPGKPPSPAMTHGGRGASVVVGTRESRVQGEGKQSTSAELKPQGKAMYVASVLDRAWLLSEQRKLYARSYEKSDYVFVKLWGLVTDPRNLRNALSRVARNRGRRTAGVDGFTVEVVLRNGIDAFVAQLREELRTGRYRPAPVRRVMIPKQGQPGKFRPLGIPTVKDRVVQAALKNVVEPIFEADFYPSSYGFRPGRGALAALEELRKLLFPMRHRDTDSEDGFPYLWAIEGDIKGCFDNIDHHGLMNRIRRRVADAKVNRLVVAFLKAGIMSEEQFSRTDAGTPQGGILSPLLANIALSIIDERYERHVWPRWKPRPLRDRVEILKRAVSYRRNDRTRTHRRVVFVPVRYADDFIILVGASHGTDRMQRSETAAREEKAALAESLRMTLGLELSEEKTLVTRVTRPMRFLGHHVRVQRHPKYGWLSKTVIPKDKSKQLRVRIRRIFASNTRKMSLRSRLVLCNFLLRGWSSYYRHAWGAKRIFASIDHFVWRLVRRWLREKHSHPSMRRLYARYGWRKPGGRAWRWRDDDAVLFETARQRVGRFRHAWLRPADFTLTSTESPVQNESCTPGSEGGA